MKRGWAEEGKWPDQYHKDAGSLVPSLRLSLVSMLSTRISVSFKRSYCVYNYFLKFLYNLKTIFILTHF